MYESSDLGFHHDTKKKTGADDYSEHNQIGKPFPELKTGYQEARKGLDQICQPPENPSQNDKKQDRRQNNGQSTKCGCEKEIAKAFHDFFPQLKYLRPAYSLFPSGNDSAILL
jgi:hypothetical protein